MSSKIHSQTDIAIIGAGAAGLMAAIAAGRAGASVRILDSAKKIGAKILVSGGCRCNVTNADVVPARFNGEGAAAFVSRVLRAFSTHDTHRFFAQIGVDLKLEPSGKFFPVSDSSRTVLAALLGATESANAVLSTETPVGDLEKVEGGWCLETPHELLFARAVIVATGGLALPKSGSDGRGYVLARKWGHSIIKTTPALSPLWSKRLSHAAFSGVTLPARLRLYQAGQARLNEKIVGFDGSFLFTHTGYSGPVALNISRHVARWRWKFPNASVFASFLPFIEEGGEKAWWQKFQSENARRNTANSLANLMPEKLAEEIAFRAECAELPVGKLQNHHVEAIKNQLFWAPLHISEIAPYEKAETTAGGIALEELEPHSMRSRLHTGLYFCGEVCDVDGWLGGYNFQWAWSSGTVAGRAAAKAVHQAR